MTTMWIMSDLHVDVHAYQLPEPRPACDVVVIPGDNCERLAQRALPWIRERFDGSVPVIYVPGNHDFWRGRIPREIETGRICAAHHGYIHLLAEGEAVEIAGTRFVGATLWTDYRIAPDATLAMLVAGDRHQGMNDHRRIQGVDRLGSPCRWTPRLAQAAHVAQRARIEAVLAESFDGPTVVVTHHAPHPQSLRGGAFTTTLDAAYASDLSSILCGPHAPALWVHGHIHERRDYTICDTRIVANPRGYVSQGPRRTLEIENPAFDPQLVIEV